jgi:hypothetical protein
MGRRHLSRLVLSVAALATASTAVATTGLRWQEVAAGLTMPSGKHATVGYLSVSRRQERVWLSRLPPGDRSAVTRLDLTETAAVAVFLDGFPCGSHIDLIGATREGSTLTIRLAYTPLPAGVAACVRIRTPYHVLGIPRTSLGRPAPVHVDIAARARG